jgi:hypothetical protein
VKLFLKIAQWYIPARLKKRELKKLFNITSEIFGCAAPSIAGLSFEESIARYAQFTRALVDQSHEGPDTLKRIQDALFQQAYEFGNTYRKIFRVSTMHEAMDAGKILYRILGINFQSTAVGRIEILSCVFSTYYSASTCNVMSFLDAGFMAGLSGGGRLTFSQRITEGYHCCRAQFIQVE